MGCKELRAEWKPEAAKLARSEGRREGSRKVWTGVGDVLKAQLSAYLTKVTAVTLSKSDPLLPVDAVMKLTLQKCNILSPPGRKKLKKTFPKWNLEASLIERSPVWAEKSAASAWDGLHGDLGRRSSGRGRGGC